MAIRCRLQRYDRAVPGNVDIVRRAFEAATRRPPDFDTVNALFDSGHEFVSRTDMGLDGGVRRGMLGYRDWLQDNEETADFEWRVEEVREIGADLVLAITPTSFRFKRSGVPLEEQRFACVVTLRDGKIVRTEVHLSEEDALEAARSAG